MIVNFKAREISRGARKLARTPTLNWKKEEEYYNIHAYMLENNVLTIDYEIKALSSSNRLFADIFLDIESQIE